ncbi:hypothetical protein Agub_g2007 [Astrephomene gubernaculifera]|uniref:Uncharacterized protein n=1 Tax=Astrephomene gubernaculifera TaxID=47775 RepID=A0AAD3DGW6_9CHLO|nr:hypothetical protein Agub_g2007 [Astrephomene gubernaculifera]
MDKAAVAVLQGVSLSPIPTCSCAKGLAAGVRIVAESMPEILRGSAALLVPKDVGSSMQQRQQTESTQEPGSRSKWTVASSSPKDASAPSPDLDLASGGSTGAREAHYLMLMALHQQ